MSLRALVIGSGYAGQGHALALRESGVEIAAMASRTEEVVRRVARELAIPEAATDWRAALEKIHPEIVAVATPGGTHVEMISAALDAGCHVYADKPLATTAADSRVLYERALRAGVKTAYAASYRYQPQALLARRLVRKGAIGRVEQVECVSHFDWPRLTPFGWPHRLDQGGGRLNNNFPHKLAIVLNVLGGEVLAAAGETRNDLKRAPVGPHLHDFRDFTRAALSPEEAAQAKWRDVDSDWSYTALCRIGDPAVPEQAASAVFRHSCLVSSRVLDHIAFYGDAGGIHIEGAYATGAVYRRQGSGSWEEVPVPDEIRESLPPIEDNTQRNWTQLARDFVADIRGEDVQPYLTFHDGWIFQEVIERVRAGASGYYPSDRLARGSARVME
jgi:predicted dehydrogenase